MDYPIFIRTKNPLQIEWKLKYSIPEHGNPAQNEWNAHSESGIEMKK